MIAEADPRLVEEFHLAMLQVYSDAKRLARYNAAFFLQMVHEHGGLSAAKRLLHAPVVQSGLIALWEKDQLAISMENVVLQRRFGPLFDDNERTIARQRLEAYGFRVS